MCHRSFFGHRAQLQLQDVIGGSGTHIPVLIHLIWIPVFDLQIRGIMWYGQTRQSIALKAMSVSTIVANLRRDTVTMTVQHAGARPT